ncbi:MAG TPA: hypothetical protein VK698_29880, partial [Kofleriaceae bacterium]|nr:hypothetical protein [Kofleriaceae bacterium]
MTSTIRCASPPIAALQLLELQRVARRRRALRSTAIHTDSLTSFRPRCTSTGLALAVALLSVGTAACAGSARGADGDDSADLRWSLSQPIVFTGACDASGAAGLSGGRIAVADDEDNHLRVYDLDAGGAPLELLDVSADLVDPGGKHPELDLEASATVGSRI